MSDKVSDKVSDRKAKQAGYAKKHHETYKVKRKAKRLNRRADRLQKYYDLKSRMSCSICGENDPVAIEFHHLDPSIKENHMNRMARDHCWDRVIEELEKCIPLCSNCHKKVHAYEEWANKINETHLIKVPTIETG